MKILQLTSRFPWPLKDGGALCNFNAAQGYKQAGCEYILASLNTSKHFIAPEELPAELLGLGNIYSSYIDNDVKVWDAFLNLFSSKSYHVIRFISRDFEKLLKEVCRKHEPDVVVFESIFMTPYLSAIRQHSTAVCVLRQHNVEFEIWQTLADNETNPLKKWYLSLLASRLKNYECNTWNLFDGVLSLTLQDKQRMQELGCSRPVLVAPFGINLENLSTSETMPELSVFHIGSMDWMPNQEAIKWFLEQVWPVVHQKNPTVSFYIAGRNMPAHFHDYHGKKNVVVVGEVDDARAFMKQHAIMVVPLFSGSGMRIKILEGLALGKCIVSSPLGAQGIDVADGKDIFIATTAQAFAEKLNHLLQHPERVNETGQQAAALVQRSYNNRNIIESMLSFYQSLKPNNYI